MSNVLGIACFYASPETVEFLLTQLDQDQINVKTFRVEPLVQVDGPKFNFDPTGYTPLMLALVT